jgi:periplasmic protein CpxP/Spy
MTTSGISGSSSNYLELQSLRELNRQNQAQNSNMPPKPNADDMVEKMSSDLGLSDDQKTKLKAILEKDMAAREAEMQKNQASGTRPDSSTMKANMDSLNNQIKAILTPEQLTTFNSILESRKNDMPSVNQDGRVDTYA